MSEKVVNTKTCELSFLEGDVVHVRFNADRVVDASEVQEMFETMYEVRGKRKSLFMVSVDDGTTLSNEARSLASSADASKYIVADAIIIRDFQHELSANAFIRHNKPPRPIKTFDEFEKAIEWLGTQHHLVENPD
jgi:hypothetical protein